jgi:single-strand DNA-binding protein
MNKTLLMGRLTKEPELRYTSNNNKAVCTFTLAVPRRFSKDETDFINIQAWEKLAEFCGKYFQKGRQVVIVGRIQNRSWDDAEGKKKYATEVIADEAYFADGKKEDSGVNTKPSNTQPEDETDLPF